jgi:hypothetical protein
MKKPILVTLLVMVGFALVGNSFRVSGAAQGPGIRREVPKTVQVFPSVRKTGNVESVDQRPIQFKLTTLPEDVVNLRTDSSAKAVTISTVMMPSIVGRRVKMSELQNGARPAGLSASISELGQSRRVSLVTREEKGQKTLIDLAVPEGVQVEITVGEETVYKGVPTSPVMVNRKKQVVGARQLETAYFMALGLNSTSGIRVGTGEKRVEIQPRSDH